MAKDYINIPNEIRDEHMAPIYEKLRGHVGEPDWQTTWTMDKKQLEGFIKKHESKGVIWINNSLDRRTYLALDRVSKEWDRPLRVITSLTPAGLYDNDNLKFIATFNFTYNFSSHLLKNYRQTMEWGRGYVENALFDKTYTMLVGTGDGDRDQILRTCLDHQLGLVGAWSHMGNDLMQIPRRVLGKDEHRKHIDWQDMWLSMPTIIESMWHSRVVVALENLCGEHPHTSITEKSLWGYLAMRPQLMFSGPGTDLVRRQLGFRELAGIPQQMDGHDTQTKSRLLVGELWRIHHQPEDQYRQWMETQGDTLNHNHEAVWRLPENIERFVDRQLERFTR